MSRQQKWQDNNNKKTHCACECVCVWRENWGSSDSDNGNNHNTSKGINNATQSTRMCVTTLMCVCVCAGKMETNELQFQLQEKATQQLRWATAFTKAPHVCLPTFLARFVNIYTCSSYLWLLPLCDERVGEFICKYSACEGCWVITGNEYRHWFNEKHIRRYCRFNYSMFHIA